jgi:hypothetical protein
MGALWTANQRWLVRGATAAILLAVSFGGCDGDDGSGGSGAGVDIEDVVYDMEGGDEALQAMLAATPKTDAANAAAFDAPLDGDAVPAAAPFTFRWHVGASSSRFEPTRWLVPPIERRKSVKSRLAHTFVESMLGGVSTAHAHGPPVEGRAYFLVLSTDADAKLFRVFTKNTQFTPDAEAWDRIVAAGAPITASVLTADFETNRIAQDGGPFEGVPITFTVAAE